MAYTASALSFMLEELGKTVIITGAQIPLSELRNDAVDNVSAMPPIDERRVLNKFCLFVRQLLGALTIARDYLIPEVSLYFNHRLYRGTRTTKSSAFDFEAFTSPNLPPLVSTGTQVRVAWDLVQRPTALKPFRAHLSLEGHVAVLSLFPGITGAFVDALVQTYVNLQRSPVARQKKMTDTNASAR